MIVKLTPDFIANNLVCPEGKRRIEYVDVGGTGLYVEARQKSPGQGTYYLRYKDANGKTCHEKIGRTTDIDLDEARRRAKTLRAEITLGKDPRSDKKATKVVLTLDQAVKEFVFPNLHRLRSAKKYEQMYNRRISQRLGSTPINAVTRAQILSFFTSLVKDEKLSPATANRHLAMLRRCFSLLVELNLLESNPASRIPMYSEPLQEQYLEPADLEKLLRVLKENNPRNLVARLVVLYLLSTGARLNEALQAKWKDVYRANKLWRIPATNSKSKKVRSVPLNASAIEVLDQLDTEGTHEYLFVNRDTQKPYTTIHKTWNRLRIKAGLPRLKVHSLRHQYASFLVNGGRTLYEVQQILGHSDPSVTQRYAHLSTKSLQDAANSASDAINAAMPESP
jgi:integrase